MPIRFHEHVLPSPTRRMMPRLKRLKSIYAYDFYLAGGTGLALQLGHRISNDLDFFSKKRFSCQKIIEELSFIDVLTVSERERQSLNTFLLGTKLSFLGYPYPLLFPLVDYPRRDLKVADIRDIGCMKLNALVRRGMKRDFVDLYVLAKEIGSLSHVLEWFGRKYKSATLHSSVVRKSIIYFKDAEHDPMPNMLKNVRWADVKKFFTKSAKALF